jgi:hypothetical protein
MTEKHIEGLRRENEILLNIGIAKEKIINKKSQQFILFNTAYLIAIASLLVLISMLYYSNGLLATDNQTKENWKRSAIILDGKYNDLQDDMKVQKKAFDELSKTCTEAQIKKAVKNTPPPPMVRNGQVKSWRSIFTTQKRV